MEEFAISCPSRCTSADFPWIDRKLILNVPLAPAHLLYPPAMHQIIVITFPINSLFFSSDSSRGNLRPGNSAQHHVHCLAQLSGGYVPWREELQAENSSGEWTHQPAALWFHPLPNGTAESQDRDLWGGFLLVARRTRGHCAAAPQSGWRGRIKGFHNLRTEQWTAP